MSQVGADVESRIGYTVKRLQQALRTAADEVLRPIGLTMPQYAALAVLAVRPGLSNSELARQCFVTRQTMNEVLVGLQRAGLISRAAHPRDGRVQQTELTVAARDVLVWADQEIAVVEKRMTVQLNATQRRQLLSMLHICTDSLEAPRS